jgi:hypothetical protein
VAPERTTIACGECDWQTSIGLGLGKPRTYAAFYDLYQPGQLRFFDATAAAVNALRHRHYGPW